MKSLYRKYRPLNLLDVVGQEQVVKPLLSAFEQDKISHAYLFTGPRGTGKTSVARIFAHMVNGFEYQLEDDYVDIIEIDGASNRGVDNIREIREKAAIKPTTGKYKIYIIDEVHMLTKEAFNALLKTLEEPPEHVIFIMATTDAHKVPITITSRAQVYNFKLASGDIIFKHLRSICEKEKINISDEALKVLVRRGGGSFRDSLSILDQVSTISEKEITKEILEKVLGLPEDKETLKLLEAHKTQNLPEITRILKNLFESGVRAEIVAEEIISEIIDDPQPEYLPLLDKLTEIKEPFADARLIVALMPDSPKNILIKDKEPEKEVETAKKPTTTTSSAAYNPAFDWGDFVEKVKSMNDAISSQLKDAKWKVVGKKLYIYPAKNFFKVILKKPENKKILEEASGLAIDFDDDQEMGESSQNSGLNTKLSDIMGGEVRDYGGGNPF